jgi:hypothetical protein
MKYPFSFTINDKEKKLSPKSGISLCALSKILCDMYEATDPGDGSTVTLSGINNHGYTPTFVTESEYRYDRFIDVHNRIHDRGIEDLTPKEAKYARTLKGVLKGGLYIEPHDKDEKIITTINASEIKQTVQGYFSSTTVYGIITEMGSQNLAMGTHIYLDGFDYKIFTSPEQDAMLRSYYRNGRLSLKVRQKRSLQNNKIINASLISFRPIGNFTLMEGISKLTDEDLKFLDGINNQDDINRLLGK